MKKILILGAGMVTKPMVDYFIDICKYQVILADKIISKIQKLKKLNLFDDKKINKFVKKENSFANK